jgi:hypothetical protein
MDRRARRNPLLMTKRPSNRAAWRLAAILAVVVLGAGGALWVNSRRGLPPPAVRAITLHRNEWGFGWGQGVVDGEDTVSVFYLVRLGYFRVELDWPIGRR